MKIAVTRKGKAEVINVRVIRPAWRTYIAYY